jgi:hypothetical protein
VAKKSDIKAVVEDFISSTAKTLSGEKKLDDVELKDLLYVAVRVGQLLGYTQGFNWCEDHYQNVDTDPSYDTKRIVSILKYIVDHHYINCRSFIKQNEVGTYIREEILDLRPSEILEDFP